MNAFKTHNAYLLSIVLTRVHVYCASKVVSEETGFQRLDVKAKGRATSKYHSQGHHASRLTARTTCFHTWAEMTWVDIWCLGTDSWVWRSTGQRPTKRGLSLADENWTRVCRNAVALGGLRVPC
jgi:hypothetical protein